MSANIGSCLSESGTCLRNGLVFVFQAETPRHPLAQGTLLHPPRATPPSPLSKCTLHGEGLGAARAGAGGALHCPRTFRVWQRYWQWYWCWCWYFTGTGVLVLMMPLSEGRPELSQSHPDGCWGWCEGPPVGGEALCRWGKGGGSLLVACSCRARGAAYPPRQALASAHHRGAAFSIVLRGVPPPPEWGARGGDGWGGVSMCRAASRHKVVRHITAAVGESI
jgi:hypothetical protein